MADTLFGYAGKILEVDLTMHSTKTVEVTPELAQKYLGGVGFGAYFLWNRMKAGVDPLGPDNVLMFMTGPMTGTGASGTRWNAIFKSPHTGAWARTAQGGDIGPELKYAGWDGIIITGASPASLSTSTSTTTGCRSGMPRPCGVWIRIRRHRRSRRS